MYCLLCHEKIPRLRAWRTKSEFCSDEHAAQYKKQTLDRLLTDQNPAPKELPNPIALGNDFEEAPEHDEMAFVAEEPVEAREEELVETQTPIETTDADSTNELELPSELSDADESIDSVEELWRLAEEVEQADDGPSFIDEPSETSGPPRQSAEEALRALRMLASKATGSQDNETDAPLDAEQGLDEFDDLPPISDDMMDELETTFPSFEDSAGDSQLAAAAEEPSEHRAEHEQTPPKADDDAPSILERLMEEPAQTWAATPPRAEAPPDDSPELEALDAVEDPLDGFRDLPEPEFGFDDVLAEAGDPVNAEPPADVELFEEPAALADDLDEPEIDPLAELIKAEEAAQATAEAAASSEGFDDPEFDEAVAEQLVNELAEEAFRDDIDLQELERSLKVVPFPTPDREPGKNGHHQHADEIAADSDEALESNPLPAAEEEPKPAAQAKQPTKRTPSTRPGAKRTKFKPSMVMAGVEPSMQGYLQGDPLEAWRSSAVKSAWGEEGAPSAYGFRAASGNDIAWVSNELEAFRPERSYRARLGVPITLCTPAQAPPVEPPAQPLEPQRFKKEQTRPQSIFTSEASAIRLGPEYRAFEDAVLISVTAHDEGEAIIPAEVQDSASVLQAALAPSDLFYDSVAVEEPFADEDDWDSEPQSSDDPVDGFDLGEDFASEQPATQSSGGRGGR